jgi:hypothetical protein
MAQAGKRRSDAFGPADLDLLSAIRGHDGNLRALLCTLARTGVALRNASPKRAQRWLDELSVHPLFKGGQFIFDLLEWEDFMLDGEAPPLLDGNTARVALDRVAASLRAFTASFEGREPAAVEIDLSILGRGPALPELQAGFYLYHDVVLGAISMLTRAGRQ